MKDLLKICRRNILTAVLTVCLVLAVNIIFFFIYILRENQHKTDPYYYSWRVEALSASLTEDGNGGYLLSGGASLNGSTGTAPSPCSSTSRDRWSGAGTCRRKFLCPIP